jgi:predicted ArsR family transcriptional regulator
MAEWTFVTNHGAVLALIDQHGQITAKDIADALGMTERPVRRIIAELEASGYLSKERVGRVNQYRVNLDLPLRRPEARATMVGELLQVLNLSGAKIAKD